MVKYTLSHYLVMALLVTIGIAFSFIIISCDSTSKATKYKHQLDAYKAYYNASEHLLNEIEDVHGWSDTVGESDAYIEWYNARKNIVK